MQVPNSSCTLQGNAPPAWFCSSFIVSNRTGQSQAFSYDTSIPTFAIMYPRREEILPMELYTHVRIIPSSARMQEYSLKQQIQFKTPGIFVVL